MSVQAWLLFCATETVLCFTPGPAVLLVVSLALTRGPAAGLGASFGILAANTAYFILSATSLGAILLASWDLFVLIKWAGAAYLIYLGAKMLFAPAVALPTAPAEVERPRTRSFIQGFLTQVANPKALIFFAAILPQFIDTSAPVAFQVMILGISSARGARTLRARVPRCALVGAAAAARSPARKARRRVLDCRRCAAGGDPPGVSPSTARVASRRTWSPVEIRRSRRNSRHFPRDRRTRAYASLP